jgi:hypothetical protein
VALNTYEYLKESGNVITAIQQGLVAMNYRSDEPYEWVLTDTYQLLNHGINPAGDALQCADCHGSSSRMDLQGELGYQLKDSENRLCSQCHESERSEGFHDMHSRHVDSKNLECNNCHMFSRPERRLNGSGGYGD